MSIPPDSYAGHAAPAGGVPPTPQTSPAIRGDGGFAVWPDGIGLLSAAAERAVKLRTRIGWFALVVGAFILLSGVVSAETSHSFTTDPSVAAVAVAMILLEAGAYLGVGAWNLALRRSAAAAPLIAAVVVSGTELALWIAQLVTPAGFPGVGGVLNVMILVYSVSLLREKRRRRTTTGGA